MKDVLVPSYTKIMLKHSRVHIYKPSYSGAIHNDTASGEGGNIYKMEQ